MAGARALVRRGVRCGGSHRGRGDCLAFDWGGSRVFPVGATVGDLRLRARLRRLSAACGEGGRPLGQALGVRRRARPVLGGLARVRPFGLGGAPRGGPRGPGIRCGGRHAGRAFHPDQCLPGVWGTRPGRRLLDGRPGWWRRIGLDLGGFLAQGPGWEAFLSTVPVGVLGVLLAPLLLHESSDPAAPPKLDAAGATTVTAALALWSTASRGRKRRVSPPRAPSVL